MLINLLYGLPIMGICLLLQSLLIVTPICFYAHHQTQVKSPSFWLTLVVINGVMLLLIIGNIAQVAIWALSFRLLGEFQGFSEAVYHSAVNFATLGYDDIIMSDKYKFLGPLEAINGVLMIGVSTAALMAAFQDAMKKTIKAQQEAIK